ncbi:expansin-B6-like [Henckelia pumila]|uniref:expansin-B6-like n=1 Tax=Henckelia pumila TaxID=405737 RepID=UPI003C6E3013
MVEFYCTNLERGDEKKGEKREGKRSASSPVAFVVHDWGFTVKIVSGNDSSTAALLSGIATWYGNPSGGGNGGACGYSTEVENSPYYAMIAAGNNDIFNSGMGCGACFQVKCTENTACSGNPITVTITDQCPGCENNHLDLSGKAFGSMANPGHADPLRSAGRINIQYQRVPCHYNTNIHFRIDTGSNTNYLAFVMEFVNGDGDLGTIELQASNSNAWMPMQLSWGVTWKIDLHNGEKGPFSVRLTSKDSQKVAVASQVIPENWAPGVTYQSGINF